MSTELEQKSKIIDFLKKEFINYSDFELDGVNLDTELNEIGLDSLDLIEIAMDLEHEFTIDIRDDEVEDIVNVGGLVKLVSDKIRENK